MKQQESFWSGWGERLTAMRNIPPVLKIVWESGPAVVTAGVVLRLLLALLPLGLLSVTRLIIDGVVQTRQSPTHSVPQHFWWLVAAEFSLAVLGSLISRSI